MAAGGLFQFYLSGSPLAASPGATLTMTVTDAAGKNVFTLTASASRPAVTGAAYLAAGSHSVRIALAEAKGVALPDVAFDLLGGVGSDPIGTYSPGTSRPGSGGTTGSSGGYSYIGSSTGRPAGVYYTF